MKLPTPDALLRRLESKQVAPKGERALDMEQASARDCDTPEPVLLLTNAALYARAAAAGDWSRLPLRRMGGVRITSDPSGILTRYNVTDTEGRVAVDLALPLARASFRERLQELGATFNVA